MESTLFSFDEPSWQRDDHWNDIYLFPKIPFPWISIETKNMNIKNKKKKIFIREKLPRGKNKSNAKKNERWEKTHWFLLKFCSNAYRLCLRRLSSACEFIVSVCCLLYRRRLRLWFFINKTNDKLSSAVVSIGALRKLRKIPDSQFVPPLLLAESGGQTRETRSKEKQDFKKEKEKTQQRFVRSSNKRKLSPIKNHPEKSSKKVEKIRKNGKPRNETGELDVQSTTSTTTESTSAPVDAKRTSSRRKISEPKQKKIWKEQTQKLNET